MITVVLDPDTLWTLPVGRTLTDRQGEQWITVEMPDGSTGILYQGVPDAKPISRNSASWFPSLPTWMPFALNPEA